MKEKKLFASTKRKISKAKTAYFMKRKLFYVLMITSMLFLSACGSSISVEDYASVVNENASLKAEIESLSAEKQSLSDKNKELLNEETDKVIEEYHDATTTAWIETSFGDDSVCFSDPNHQYLQCIASNTYSITEKGISDLWDNLLLSMNTLSLCKDAIPYRIVSVRFLDPSGEHILDIILDMNEESNIMKSMTCNITYANTVIPILQKLAQN